MISLFNNRFKVSPITLAQILSILYWTYLAMVSQMAIIHDSIGYERLGYMLYEGGFPLYLAGEPTREPVYPLFISWSINMGYILGVSYKSILITGQFAVLFITQRLMLIILKKLNINTLLSAAVILYFAFSPAITTTAIRLYSEVLVYPFILSAVILSYKLWEHLTSNTPSVKYILSYSVFISFNFVILVLSKGIFQLITPLYVITFFPLLIRGFKNKKLLKNLSIAFIIGAMCYSYPLHLYKGLNKKYNGFYTLTRHGGWALYGNTARRMAPLTWKRFVAAVTFGGDGFVCSKVSAPEDCLYWSYVESDKLGAEKRQELSNQGLDLAALDKELIRLSKNKILNNPPQFILLAGVESIKMFIWESTRDGYTVLPEWLRNLHQSRVAEFPFIFITSILTASSLFFCLVYIWRNKKLFVNTGHEEAPLQIITFITTLVILFIGIYSIFFILRRYAFPIVPLYLILIAFFVQSFIKNPAVEENTSKKNKKNRKNKKARK